MLLIAASALGVVKSTPTVVPPTNFFPAATLRTKWNTSSNASCGRR
jgi:hypothetical protein